MRLIVVSFLLISLAACSPVNIPQKKLYALAVSNSAKVARAHGRKTLLVMSMQADPALQTKKIAYVNQPYQIAYFAKNMWVAAPADQLTAIITHGLQSSGYFKAVVATPFVGVTDLKLNTHLYKLQQNFLMHPSVEQFVMSAQLINANSGKIIREKTFHYSIPAMSDNPYGGVVAANKAVTRMLKNLIQFCHS